MTRNLKILFVDDDRDFLKAQSAFFGSRGFTVFTADTRESAMTTLETETPDVIVLDLMMEHYDSGFTLGHRIRQDERFQNVPILMLSGVASMTGHKFGGELDGLKRWSKLDAFLDKPITGKQLLRAIEERVEQAPSAG
jgi:CheY-like chemotaxis protein